MTTLSLAGLVRRTAGPARLLMALTGLMAITAVVSVAGLLFDDRVLTGEPIWLKPFKFSVSFALYGLTWAWLLALRKRPSRLMSWSAAGVVLFVVVEMALIVGQVLRGRASHFNVATTLDSNLFKAMGVAIAVVWVLSMVAGVLVLRERMADRSMAWAIRFGIVIGSVGMGLALLMTGSTAEQAAQERAGVQIARSGAHTVGAPDGGPGMPITGWSTVGGDLRIPHFFGIHAMQALPLLAALLMLLARRLPKLVDPAVRTRLVFVGGGAYAGLLALVTWQALRGQSLVRPDLWTLAALGTLVAAVAAGTRFALRSAPDLAEVR